ncbi:MAG: helix-turn-helix domain-containing protein [Candidatus Dormibacteraeota bacterium]|nr:helix-turn-helix domain-containing protein [Candidatus Dormibacteraeota bacterium]
MTTAPAARRAAAARRPAHEVLRENESLRRLITVNGRLTGLALQGAELDSIAAVLASALGGTAAVLDPILKTLVTAADGEPGAPDLAWLDSDPQLALMLGAVAASRQAVRIPARPDLGQPGYVLAPIIVGDDVLAYLVGLGAGSDPGDFDLLVTEHAASMSAIVLSRRRIAAEVGGRVKDDLIDALLLGHSRSAQEGWDWAEALGYESGRRYRAVAMVAEGLTLVTGENDPKGPASTALRRRLFQSIAHLVGNRAPGSIVSGRQDDVVVILPEPLPGEIGVTARQLGEAATRHVGQLAARARLTIGIGAPCPEPTALAQSYRQARRAIAIARRLGRTGEVVVFEELGIYRLLFQTPDDGELEDFVQQVLGPLLAYDEAHGAGLVPTLTAYLAHNGSLHAAAADLHIHHNTVNYRLSRIQEIAALDLHTHDGRLAAGMAVKVYEGLRRA